jgi:hypothetical protein
VDPAEPAPSSTGRYTIPRSRVGDVIPRKGRNLMSVYCYFNRQPQEAWQAP